MMKGKKWKLVVDERGDARGIYVRDLPLAVVAATAEVVEEWYLRNERPILSFFIGAMLAVLVVMLCG